MNWECFLTALYTSCILVFGILAFVGAAIFIASRVEDKHPVVQWTVQIGFLVLSFALLMYFMYCK